MRLLPFALAVLFGVKLGLAPAILAQSKINSSSETIVPNENLVVEGVPPISNELANTVARYTGLFMAGIVKGLGVGGQTYVERELGWNRRTIRKGLNLMNCRCSLFPLN